jgi:hypothetical protein
LTTTDWRGGEGWGRVAGEAGGEGRVRVRKLEQILEQKRMIIYTDTAYITL